MIEPNALINGDCLIEMRNIPDKSCDMICTDLPYGVLNKDNPSAQWDRIIPLEPLWEQYLRIIKDNGAIVLFGQGMFTAKLMMSQPKLWRYNLIWDKCRATEFLNAKRMPLRQHEDILVFYKSLPTYNPQMTEGEPSHPQGNGKHKNTNNCYGEHKSGAYEKVSRSEPTRPGQKFPTSIIRIRKEHESTVYHPTQKSVELLRYLIRTYTNVGDIVLDNTMGAGSTCVAAVLEHRKYIGIEKNGHFYDIAVKRVREVERQPTLF